jgi:hypothetical protein
MVDLFAFLGTFTGILYPIVLILYFVGIPFLVAGLVRLILHFTKYDKKKANKIFWILWIILIVVWFLFMLAFYTR